MPHPADVGLGHEIKAFESVADRVTLGDLEIRRLFARNILWLFIAANAFVFTSLGVVFWRDGVQLAAHIVSADQRIIDSRVVMSVLGASTVQLGAAIYTITRAIFPTRPTLAA